MSDNTPSTNPDHNRPNDPDGPAGAAQKQRLRLYAYHKNNGSPERFYELYPEERERWDRER